MKLLAAVSFASLFAAAAVAFADPPAPAPCPDPDPCKKGLDVDADTPAAPPSVAAVQPSDTPAPPTRTVDDDGGWRAPPGKRFVSGFRLGWMYINDIDKPNASRPNGESLAMQYGLKSPNMFVIGYEGFYRVIGHSWLNVLMVGNVSVAGVEQSKFLPSASGLLGFEFDRSFQIGVGVNVVPDAQAISHMIIAAGWTPSVGSIQTPVHGFFMPDPDGNYRVGATVGMNW